MLRRGGGVTSDALLAVFLDCYVFFFLPLKPSSKMVIMEVIYRFMRGAEGNDGQKRH